MKKWVLLLTLAAFTHTSAVIAQEIPAQPATDEAAPAAASYAIDVSHSTLGFAVKHMGVSTTRGKFNDFSGAITYNAKNPSKFSADVTIDANSVDTDNENRDNHLRNEDFFDVAKFPNITFKNAKLDGSSIVGDLTIKDVTKSISIPVEIVGPVKGMGSADVIGITGETTINRQEYNVKWSKALDAGGLVVADDVKLIVEIEAKAGGEKK